MIADKGRHKARGGSVRKPGRYFEPCFVWNDSQTMERSKPRLEREYQRLRDGGATFGTCQFRKPERAFYQGGAGAR